MHSKSKSRTKKVYMYSETCSNTHFNISEDIDLRDFLPIDCPEKLLSRLTGVN